MAAKKPRQRLIQDIVEALRLEHTIFALPFAYVGVWTAAEGSPSGRTIALVTAAMVGARTAGMALNRLIDLPIDRKNPRTQNWPVPSGRVKPSLLILLTVIALAVFFAAAYALNPLCARLSPAALMLLVVYPTMKRFSWLCHFWLGLVLAAAPTAGWLAVSGKWELELIPLFVGVFFWVSGFDILYALLDIDFDRREGVYSIPGHFGLQPALWISRIAHFLAVVAFGFFGIILNFQTWFWAGWALMAGLLIYEHRLVGPGRLEKINKAFFAVNGWISVLFFLFNWLELRS
jgi:4-hydroxybenzoate polyprenyltransferase